MKKLILCFSVVCVGLLSSCVEKHQLGDADEEKMPTWLGSSIYSTLRNAESYELLDGQFSTYLRLVDDLGYSETLDRTGSVTIFPANDDAFDRFFSTQTAWTKADGSPVRSYAELSLAQKKMLLYSSMLGNALLTNMLSNVTSSSGSTVIKGIGLKHSTQLGLIDTVTVYSPEKAKETYHNNAEWTEFTAPVALVMDATTPMMIHFTPEYMLSQNITTLGDGSDFSLLMGGDYNNGDTYIFRNRVVNSNMTCLNGYIHQVDNVIVPPGNLAQLIKNSPDMQIMSRMLDRFAVPVKNEEASRLYRDWYQGEEAAGKDMTGVYKLGDTDYIYEVRYISNLSQGSKKFDNEGKVTKENLRLRIDPGWNGYFKTESNQSARPELRDMAAMFVPTDDVFIDYFVNGEGIPIMQQYGPYPNTAENVMKNIDFIPIRVIAPLVSNMQQEYFSSTVPSKFASIVDGEAGDFMEITMNDVKADAEGNYDIRIANNGVVYSTNRVLTPPSYVAVSAPAKFNENMSIMDWMINNETVDNPIPLNQDFYAYLLAMKANYALFIPTNEAFSAWYVDPATLKHLQPEVVHYYVKKFDADNGEVTLEGSRWKYDPETNTVGDSIDVIEFAATDLNRFRSHMVDMLNYHTLVLKAGEELGSHTYYKTKHGGAVKVQGSLSQHMVGGNVIGGQQQPLGPQEPSVITEYLKEKNGAAYIVDHVIQGPTQSVYSVLSTTPQFAKFFEICEGLSNDELLRWAFGYDSSATLTEDQQRELDQFKVFTTLMEKPNCLDYNVRFFNMYNYTVYAPDDTAILEAQDNGLPSWTELLKLYQDDLENEYDNPITKMQVKNMLVALRDFVRYHFQNTSVFADTNPETMHYTTFLLDAQQMNLELNVNVTAGGELRVTDAANHTVAIREEAGKAVNVMTRDFDFDGVRSESLRQNGDNVKPIFRKLSTSIESSSFAVVHQISEPLYYNSTRDFSQGIK